MSPALYEQIDGYDSPVWFLYEPARGQGVINTPDWSFSPLLYNSWLANEVCHRYHLFYIWLLQSWLSIQVMYIFFGHHDPSSGKPLGHF